MHREQQIPPFVLQLRPSRYWMRLVLVILLLSVLLMPYFLSGWILLLLPVQCVLAWHALRAVGWWNPRAVQGIEVDAGGRMSWTRAGERLAVQVCDNSFISADLVLLNVRENGRKRSCLLLKDSADAEALRQLRVYLLWFHPAPENDSATVPE